MATKEDFQNLQSDLNKDLGNVKGDVQGLKDKIATLEQKVTDVLANAGMSAADEQDIFDGFASVKTDLSNLAGETPDAEQPQTEA